MPMQARAGTPRVGPEEPWWVWAARPRRVPRAAWVQSEPAGILRSVERVPPAAHQALPRQARWIATRPTSSARGRRPVAKRFRCRQLRRRTIVTPASASLLASAVARRRRIVPIRRSTRAICPQNAARPICKDPRRHNSRLGRIVVVARAIHAEPWVLSEGLHENSDEIAIRSK